LHFHRSTTQDLRTPCPLGSLEREKTTLAVVEEASRAMAVKRVDFMLVVMMDERVKRIVDCDVVMLCRQVYRFIYPVNPDLYLTLRCYLDLRS
jgi:hypothetical protein